MPIHAKIAAFTRPPRLHHIHRDPTVHNGMRTMAKVDTAPFEEAERSSRTRFRGLEFFAGQFFTILASVVGVYLAGYVSFQRTLEYDRLTKAQQKSDLLTATREELKQNVVRLQKFNERLPAESGSGVTNGEWPQLRLFVWQAAG